jgi:hypothetical protein
MAGMTSRVQGLVSDESNPRPTAAELSSSRFALILMVCIASYTLLVATQTMVFGWSMGRWNYYYVHGFELTPLLAGCLLAGFAIGCDRWIPARLALSFWFVAGLLGQILLHSFMFDRSLIQMITEMGFYGVSLSVSLRDILGHFLALHESWPLVHPASNMPGMLLLYKAIEVLVINPAGMAIVTATLSNVGAIFLYLIVESVYGDRETTIRSSILYLFIPSRIYFLPILNTLSPVPILFALLMLVGFWLRAAGVLRC